MAKTSARAPLLPPSERIRARLVNRGHDTQVTLGDGSTIVLKGIVAADAFFCASPLELGSKPRSAAAD